MRSLSRSSFLVAALMFLVGMMPMAQSALKPGSKVKPTVQEQLVVSKVGFVDQSYCWLTAIRDCSDNEKHYETTWAYSVKNVSPKISAANIRAEIIFYSGADNVLGQYIHTVARELRPGKVAYVTSAENLSDANFTGATRAEVKILSSSWNTPTKSIIQNPIELEKSPQGKFGVCLLSKPCARDNKSSDGQMTKVDFYGVFTWRGAAGYFNAPRMVIFLDAAGNPLAGWTVYGEKKWVTGSQEIKGWSYYLSDEIIGKTLTYLYTIQS